MKEVSIVIPTLNEEGSIGKTIQAHRNFFPSAEIIVVDGGSKDKTVQIAKEHRQVIVYQAKTKNASEALLYGFSKAESKRVIMTDADNTYPAADARLTFDAAREFDMDLLIGKRIRNRFFSHQLATRAIGFLARIPFPGIALDDMASGLRVMTKRFLS